MLDSGKIDLTQLPRGLWSSAVVPAVLRRLQNDSFKGDSIANLVVKRCGRYHNISLVPYQYWAHWPARGSMSVKERNSFASLRPWVDSGIAIDRTITGTLMGATGISSLPSQNAKHTYAVARSEAFDIRAKGNDTDLSVFPG